MSISKKTSKSRIRQAKKQQKQQRRIWGAGVAVAIAAIAALVLLISSNNRASVSFPDIHGMSFTGDGNQLRVATHTGIVSYEDGSWSRPTLPINDYMGYSGTEDGFFSSGHPGAGSNLINPIGLVRSQDFGATVQTINFLGETDFHVMGASYYGDTVYVLNPSQNSLLTPGLHYSLDAGQNWEQSAASGLTANPTQIAVHPTEPNLVALATQSGVFLSNDFGNTFSQATNTGAVTSIAFDPNGDRLLFGMDALFEYDLQTGQSNPLPSTPQIDAQQVIFYIGINPVTDELAVSTSDRDLYYSHDGGETWTPIGADGRSL